MNKRNLIVYSAHSPISYQIWQCLTPHNRVFLKDPCNPNKVPGVYNIEQDLYKHPSIQRTLYKPVDGIIITADEYFTDELMEELLALKPDVKVLVVNDFKLYERLEKTGLHLTFMDVGPIIKIEDLYFKDFVCVKSNDSYWADIFRYSLFNLEVINYDEKTESKVSEEL